MTNSTVPFCTRCGQAEYHAPGQCPNDGQKDQRFGDEYARGEFGSEFEVDETFRTGLETQSGGQ